MTKGERKGWDKEGRKEGHVGASVQEKLKEAGNPRNQ